MLQDMMIKCKEMYLTILIDVVMKLTLWTVWFM